MNQNRSCSNCIKGTAIFINNDVLCRDYGAVSKDYVCPRHRFAPQIKTPWEESNKCFDCENFIQDHTAASDRPIGHCRLFSERKFDGSQKKGCSKYIKNIKQEVS